MFEDIAVGAVGGLAAGGAARWVINRRAQRLMPLSKAEVALRVIAGEVPGLRTGWRHGLATLYPGRLEFVSYVGGVRLLPRRSVGVEVNAVDMGTRRGRKGWEHILLAGNCDIVTVRGPAATLELAVTAPFRLDWVLSRLAWR